MTRRATAPVRMVAVRPDHHLEMPDELATEEPMEIRVAGPGQEAGPVAVTMRTPGHDFELAAGFLFTEGVVGADDIAEVRYCQLAPDESQELNVVTVRTRRDVEVAARSFLSNSSCGVCGKASLDEIEVRCPVVPKGFTFPGSLVPRLPDRLRAAQRVFDRTGGLHAAGLFDAAGDLVCLREDVGRHNAVDKIVGHALLDRKLPLADHVLMVSGRVSFEIVQKAAVAGIPVIAAVSAPSSLAVEAAERLGVTLAGFVRGGTYNLYSHAERVDLER
jgi:FdhD protein